MANKAKQDAVLQALEKTLGVVTSACKHAEVSRSQFYEWMKDPAFRERVEEIHEQTLDFVESRLHKLIQEGSVPSTIFYLKTRGRSRGYVESQEITMREPDTKPSWFAIENEKENE